MPSTILVPVDGSTTSLGALAFALVSFPAAAVTVLHVNDVRIEWSELAGSPRPAEERAERHAQTVLDEAAALAGDLGRDVLTETTTGIPRRAILSVAIESSAEHIVIGSHGDTPVDVPFLGQEARAILARSPVPVSVVPIDADSVSSLDLPGKVLVPTDGSIPAMRALEFVLDTHPGAVITAIHAIPSEVDPDPETLRGTYAEERLEFLSQRADDLLDSVAEAASERGVELELDTVIGPPKHAIAEYAASEGFDQIVMGSRGRSGVSGAVLGSVALGVVQESPIPVTVVK